MLIDAIKPGIEKLQKIIDKAGLDDILTTELENQIVLMLNESINDLETMFRMQDLINSGATVTIVTDGACKGNPGPGAAGAMLYLDDQTTGVTQFLPETTNNQAEYTAVLIGLGRAISAGMRNVIVHTDSQLVEKQIKGEYKVKDKKLIGPYNMAIKLIKELDSFEIIHVGREGVQAAHDLCEETLEKHLKGDTE